MVSKSYVRNDRKEKFIMEYGKAMIIINTIKLIHGDCLDKLKQIKDKSVNLVLIDPPYNISKADWDKWKTVDDYVQFMGQVFLECQRVLKDNGSFYFFHNDFEQMAELQHWIKKNTKFVFMQMLVWDKFNGSKWNQLNAIVYSDDNRNYSKQAEYCLYYTFYDEKLDGDYFKSIRDYFWKEYELSGLTLKTANELMGLATTGANMAGELFGKKRKRFRFPTKEKYELLQQSGYFQRPYEELKNEYENMRYVFNGSKNDERHCVWNYPISKEVGHMTEKPLQLYYDMFEVHTKKDSKCLFPFIGSGNNIISLLDINKADNGNREYIGFETDDKWFELINDRIHNKLMK